MRTHSPTTDERSADGPVPVAAAAATRAGVLAMLPLIAGYLPFALVIGAAVAEHGTPWAGWAGSWLIYGGSAHLATVRTLDKAGLGVAVLTGLVINARLVVYSASLARRWTAQPRWFRIVAAPLIIDPTWAVAERHADVTDDPRAQRRYFIAAGLTLGTAWSAAIAVGALVGARLDWLDVDIVVPLVLVALVGASVRNRAERVVVVAAAATAVLTRDFPAGTGLLLAVAAGITAGSIQHRSAP